MLTTEGDRQALGCDTVSTASPDTRFVVIEDFRRKFMVFECPACIARVKVRCCIAGPRVECEFSSVSEREVASGFTLLLEREAARYRFILLLRWTLKLPKPFFINTESG